MRRCPKAWLIAALLVSACAAPPNKELDRAQGAIDAARAAGADRYAADEFNAAVTSLSLANDAVGQRDYRLALNHALESHNHAENAAREGAGNRARIRGEVEREMAEIFILMAQANARTMDAGTAPAPRRVIAEARKRLAQVNDDVQKVGAAMKADDYLVAQPALAGLKQRIEDVMASIDAAAPQSSRRRR
jgi:hypothetical protein